MQGFNSDGQVIVTQYVDLNTAGPVLVELKDSRWADIASALFTPVSSADDEPLTAQFGTGTTQFAIDNLRLRYVERAPTAAPTPVAPREDSPTPSPPVTSQPEPNVGSTLAPNGPTGVVTVLPSCERNLWVYERVPIANLTAPKVILLWIPLGLCHVITTRCQLMRLTGISFIHGATSAVVAHKALLAMQ